VTEALERMIRYDIWANRETVSALRQGSPPLKSLRWMSHIIGAEFLWVARIQGRPSPLTVWPELSVDECAGRVEELSTLLPDILRDRDPVALRRAVSYTNSKGEAWTSTVGEILTHVTIHSAYHRGQIASDMRSAGQEPAYTDYIHAIRQRFVT
jgi:uncharacterized damage-inducible protein DinB